MFNLMMAFGMRRHTEPLACGTGGDGETESIACRVGWQGVLEIEGLGG